ncbi:hypothetical protein BCR42DRAFT_412852 [Absidia repens]|uniref:F-box domain-containing protein n=1 Tax=Absidia repens TaxID=90262 RepID=A0A1X2IKB9_9FUNG|nr:hypothetical protein BCR42DRAFT_412852 [Absidia repens]
MTTGLAFFDIYLKHLSNPTTIPQRHADTLSIHQNQKHIPTGYKLTRHIVRSLRPSSPPTSPANNTNDNSRLLRLPPGLWLIILRHLPLSQIPELNLVCRALSCIVRYKSGFWFNTQKIMFPTCSDPISLVDGTTVLEFLTKVEWASYTVVKESFGKACDFCYQGRHLTAAKHGCSAVLPVTVVDDTRSDTNGFQRKQHIYLCLPCRLRHFHAYPEIEPYLQDNHLTLSYDEATRKYLLPKSPNNCTMLEIDAIKLGRQIHGGDIGISAERLRGLYGGTGAAANLPRNT